jgi:hypothetical protein
MAFAYPPEFALKATSGIGSGDWLAFPQPNGYRMEWAPLRDNGDGGATRQGLNNVIVVYDRKPLTQAEFAVLTAAVTAAAGLPYYCRYWDEEASSGSGAYSTVKCLLEAPTYDRIQGQHYYGASMRWRRLGIA